MSTIKLRRGTPTSATSNNPTLASGEVGVEIGTGKFKIGDGSTAWNDLEYAPGAFSVGDLGDVDTATATPSTGNAMLFDGTNWVPDGATYARRLGNLTSALGDSITFGLASSFTSTLSRMGSDSYLYQACIRSSQRLRLHTNHGVSSDNSTQILARVQDVIDDAPSVCIVLAGTNDNNDSIPTSTTKSNLTDIYAALLAAGVRPVACTLPPRGSTPIAETVEINSWIKNYAVTNGLPMVDFYAATVDADTGGFRTGYADDTTHPNGYGTKFMAEALTDAANVLVPPYRPDLAFTNDDPDNVVANGLFVDDSNTDGLADSWIAQGTGTATRSLVADPDGFGQLQQIQRTVSDANDTRVAQSASIGPANGDVVACALRLQIDNDDETGDPQQVTVTFNFRASTTTRIQHQPVYLWEPDLDDGVVYTEVTMPTGDVTNCLVTVASVGGTGYVRVGQVTVKNLTDLGLA